jgi:hypothetical protein
LAFLRIPAGHIDILSGRTAGMPHGQSE